MPSARVAHSPERRTTSAAPAAARSSDSSVVQTTEQAKSPAQILANRLAGKLGIVAPPIRTGPGAWKRTEARRTRGLWEEGQIWLDERRVDLGSVDGERLMAHELVHAAQAKKGGGGRSEVAEAEAWTLSMRMMGGEQVQPLHGLGAGQVAAEGEPVLQALQYLEKTTQKADSLKGDEPAGKPDVDQMVSAYQDQVYEVLSLLSEEELFWKLVDVVGTSEEDSALARLRSTGAYEELARQWAATQPTSGDTKVPTAELEQTRRQQQAAYQLEVHRWGWTAARNRAYRLVAEDAKLHPPAADAEVPDKVVPSAAESKVGELETKKKTSPGGLSLADALSLASVALQSAAVVRPIPAAPAPASLTGVESAGDQPFTEVDGLLAGLKSSGPPPPPGTDLRLVSTLPIFANGLGTFGYEYTKQYLDTLLIDRAGSFLDTGLDRLTKGSGLSKVLKGKYVVGPLYTIARAWYSGKRGLDDPRFWMEFAGNAEGWGTVGKSAERFGKRWDRIFFGDGSLGDRLAESFGLVADGVEVLRDVLDAIAGMFGNLSALFCVLGIMFCVMAVAFSFFLFLAWLSPLFFSLANAMFALGELLGALNSFLSLLSLLTLTPLVTLIRSYSTLIVPADRYNEEASLLQEAVNNHAQKSAAYRADRSAKDHRQAQAEHGQASELAKQGLGQAPPSDLGNRGWKKFLTLDHYRPDLIQNYNNIRSDMAESRKTIGGFSRSNQQGQAQSEKHDANAKTMEDAQKALDRQHALEVEILRKDISVERRKILERELARMGYARNRLPRKEKADRARLAAEMQVIQQKLAEIPRFKKLAKQTEALRKQLLSESEVIQHKRTVTEMRVLLSAWHYALTEGSSLNITGGFGSAWKAWLSIREWAEWLGEEEEEEVSAKPMRVPRYGTHAHLQMGLSLRARDRRFQARSRQQLEAHPSAQLAQSLAARALPAMGFRAADDPLPDLLEAVAQAHVQRQQAALANLAWREAEAQAGAAFAREAESAGWVGRWASLLVEGVQIQGAAKQAIVDTSGGHARANDRATTTRHQNARGDRPVPQDRTQTPGLGEEGDYISEFRAGGKPDSTVTDALGQAHLPAYGALVLDSMAQVQQVADSLAQQQTANSTLNTLNASTADWLLRDLSGMEGHRRDKEAAERRRNDQLLTCDASARLTLNAYGVMKEKSEETRVKYGTRSFWDNFQ